ncbi:MAG: TonB-dependent receptor, partial [Hyphomicrobiales bacterium]
MNLRIRLLIATSCPLVVITPVQAQDATTAEKTANDPNEILVTARKRQESILKVPVVANVIAAEGLQRAQIVDLQGVSTKVPGLFVSPGVSTIGMLISLRGVGTSALDAGVDQSISLNIDGQQFSQGLTFRSGLFDLAQAEVLKGPQALFFGKNSPGGVISLTTADPQDHAEVIGRVSYEFQAREPRTELILSGPVSDTLGLRLAGAWSNREGYFKNTSGATARPDLGGLAPSHSRSDGNKGWIIRGTALWRPTADFTARLKINVSRDHSENPNGLQFISCLSGTGPSVVGIPFIGGTHPCRLDDETEIVDLDPAAFPGVTNNGVPFLTLRQHYGVLDLNYNVTPDITATSTTTYYKNRASSMIHGTYAGAAASLWADNEFSRRDFTQEIRIESDANAPLNWLLGGFYQNARMKNDLVIGWNQSFAPILGPINPALVLPAVLDRGTHDVKIESRSVFGQLRWKLSDSFEIDGGVRYTDERRSNRPTRFGFPSPIPRPEIGSKNWSPELTVTYTPTDDLTIFGALKQGYKSGSYQITTPNPANEERSFGDEKVQGGEFGIKARLADRALNFNAAFYYYRFEGLQV